MFQEPRSHLSSAAAKNTSRRWGQACRTRNWISRHSDYGTACQWEKIIAVSFSLFLKIFLDKVMHHMHHTCHSTTLVLLSEEHQVLRKNKNKRPWLGWTMFAITGNNHLPPSRPDISISLKILNLCSTCSASRTRKNFRKSLDTVESRVGFSSFCEEWSRFRMYKIEIGRQNF